MQRASMTLATTPFLWLMSAVVACSVARAQAPAGRSAATRAELDSLVARAEAAATDAGASHDARSQKQREAAALRLRLKEGDFEVGDEVVISVPGDSVLSDTFPVQAGRTLLLPNLPELPLAGVLRSELEPVLTEHVARFVKDKPLRATALFRFGVLGEVAQPGYYKVAPEMTISDAIMAAGGPTTRADLQRAIVRRGRSELLSKSAVREAMVHGTTLDALHVDGGDELVVRPKREWGWQTVAQVAALVSGVVLSLRAF
jgi:protein involved in polysaccharide export with SLBB domain